MSIYSKISEAIAIAAWKAEVSANPELNAADCTAEKFYQLNDADRGRYVDIAEVVMDDAIPVILEPLTMSLPKNFMEYEEAKPWDKPSVASSLIQSLVDLVMPISDAVEKNMAITAEEGKAA